MRAAWERLPYVTMATTDARHFARLRIQAHGFAPMRLPDGYSLATIAHRADERIPVDAADRGTAAPSRVLATCGAAGGAASGSGPAIPATGAR